MAADAASQLAPKQIGGLSAINQGNGPQIGAADARPKQRRYPFSEELHHPGFPDAVQNLGAVQGNLVISPRYQDRVPPGVVPMGAAKCRGSGNGNTHTTGAFPSDDDERLIKS